MCVASDNRSDETPKPKRSRLAAGLSLEATLEYNYLILDLLFIGKNHVSTQY